MLRRLVAGPVAAVEGVSALAAEVVAVAALENVAPAPAEDVPESAVEGVLASTPAVEDVHASDVDGLSGSIPAAEVVFVGLRNLSETVSGRRAMQPRGSRPALSSSSRASSRAPCGGAYFPGRVDNSVV